MTLREEIEKVLEESGFPATGKRVLEVLDRHEAKPVREFCAQCGAQRYMQRVAMPSEERPARDFIRGNLDDSYTISIRELYRATDAIVESIDANTAAIREAKR